MFTSMLRKRSESEASTALLVRGLVLFGGLLAALVLTGCSAASFAAVNSDVVRGEALYEQGKFTAAIGRFEAALDEDGVDRPTESYLLTAIGNAYSELEDWEKSLAYYDLALDADSANYMAMVNKGIVFRLLGEYAEADEMYARAFEIAPNYAELHVSMGSLAIYQGDPVGAAAHIERAIELDDSLPEAYAALAVAYAFLGRFDDADIEIERAVQLGYRNEDIIREIISGWRGSVAA